MKEFMNPLCILQKVLVQWEKVRGLLLVKQAKPSVHLEIVLKRSAFCVR